MVFFLRASFLVLCFTVGSKAFSACAAGATDCDDQLTVSLDEAFGEVYCSCSANYGRVAEPVKSGSADGYDIDSSECAVRTGRWDSTTGAGPMLDDCENGQCTCYRSWTVRVPVDEPAKFLSGSANSKALLRKWVTIADETCQAVSVGQSKAYTNKDCYYYFGRPSSDGDTIVQENCLIRRGSGSPTQDICYLQ